MKIVLASRNKNKIAEFQVLLQNAFDVEVKVLSLDDIGFSDEIIENGETFEENAISKASVPASLGFIGIADDSGLCVDALDGAPGVYSARFSGGDDEDNNALLLKLLKNEENRNAKYVCAIACVFPDGNKFVVRGECHGKIIDDRRGEAGFGYDPLFVPVGESRTVAEMTDEEKNAISHRANAIRALVEKLKEQ